MRYFWLVRFQRDSHFTSQTNFLSCHISLMRQNASKCTSKRDELHTIVIAMHVLRRWAPSGGTRFTPRSTLLKVSKRGQQLGVPLFYRPRTIKEICRNDRRQLRGVIGLIKLSGQKKNTEIYVFTRPSILLWNVFNSKRYKWRIRR